MAELRINMGNCIHFQNATTFSIRYMDWMIKETSETELHLNNMSREDGLRFNRSWKSLTHSLKGRRKHQLQHCQSQTGH
jgi:hypothetical protein